MHTVPVVNTRLAERHVPLITEILDIRSVTALLPLYLAELVKSAVLTTAQDVRAAATTHVTGLLGCHVAMDVVHMTLAEIVLLVLNRLLAQVLHHQA